MKSVVLITGLLAGAILLFILSAEKENVVSGESKRVSPLPQKHALVKTEEKGSAAKVDSVEVKYQKTSASASFPQSHADMSEKGLTRQEVLRERTEKMERRHAYTKARRAWHQALSKARKEAKKTGNYEKYNMLKDAEPSKSDYE